MSEKREQPRFEVSLTARWQGSAAHHTVRISDLSAGGCYLDTIAEVCVDDTLWIEISLPDGTWLKLQAMVAHHFPRLGFGVRFVNPDGEQLKRLRSLMPVNYVAGPQSAEPASATKPKPPVDRLLSIDDTCLRLEG